MAARTGASNNMDSPVVMDSSGNMPGINTGQF